MSDALEVIWEGWDGSTWHVSGPSEEDEGVLLLPKVSNIIDAPITTLWVKSAFGSRYQGVQVKRRDPVLGFRVYSPNGDPAEWRDTDRAFRDSWDYEREGKLWFITDDDERYLSLRLLEEPKAYEGDPTGGYDPHYLSDGDVVITAAAENPYYVGAQVSMEYTVPSTSGTVDDFFYVDNDGDTDLWPWWACSSIADGTVWTLPDFSFDSEEYQRGSADSTRTVPLPYLKAGEHVTVLSEPDEEAIISVLDTNVWARWGGNGLLYPVPRNTPKTFVPVSWSNATVGDVIRLNYSRLYSRPW